MVTEVKTLRDSYADPEEADGANKQKNRKTQ